MPRAIWSGSISFGLVNVPVRMYSAIQESDLHFNLLHEPDGARIGYQKICKAEGEPVPDDEIVKAFEIEKGEFVILDDEDFAAVRTEGVKTIDITDFVPYDDIDPIYFERTYYLGPQDGAEKVYALLREAMERSGLAAIAKYVMRDKQNLGCLRVREGVITLEKMFFHDEIRPPDEIAPGGQKVGKQELEMATALVEQFTTSWEPTRYEDTYREALCELIRAKQKGKTVKPPEEAEPEETGDLLAALRASVEAARRTEGQGATGAKRPSKRSGASSRNGGSSRNGSKPSRKSPAKK
jgi:DNA end-binding protein Ku